MLPLVSMTLKYLLGKKVLISRTIETSRSPYMAENTRDRETLIFFEGK